MKENILYRYFIFLEKYSIIKKLWLFLLDKTRIQNTFTYLSDNISTKMIIVWKIIKYYFISKFDNDCLIFTYMPWIVFYIGK